uniref:Uncharacterized protein n=1 Tax=Amazona collaria TaxID=241587 RepID=A0A8B9IZI1_9PSIT
MDMLFLLTFIWVFENSVLFLWDYFINSGIVFAVTPHLSRSACVSDNSSQMNLSGSSSSLASEASNKNSGQRSYGIGGAYLQKRIWMIVKARDSSDMTEHGKAEAEREHRKTEGSQFRRLRERVFSRERTAFTAKREAEHTEASERSENQKDKDSDALSIASIYSNSNLWTSYCLCVKPRRRRKTI